MMKNQKGITLIALVISIIVMLILAGVSLNATIGDNGIITKDGSFILNYYEYTSKEIEEENKVKKYFKYGYFYKF